MSYPRYQLSRSFKFKSRRSTSLSLNSTTAAAVDTALDITLSGSAGDVIEYGIAGLAGTQSADAYLDVVSWASGAAVNSWSTDAAAITNGYGFWYCPSGVYTLLGPSVMRALTVDDLVGGEVTLRLQYRTVTATNKTLYADASNPLQVWAKNLGPQDPN